MNKFSEKILKRIEEKHISPKPRWQFLTKDIFVWFLGAISILVGGIATSVIIFVLVNSDWESYRFLSGSLLDHIINVAPVLWVIFLAFFILGADYNFKNTKKGYRYSVSEVVGMSILVSVILGGIFYQIGLAHITDYELGNLIDYKRFTEKRQGLWNHPSEGLLVGAIVPSEKNDILTLKDADGKEWNITVGKLMPRHFIILDNVSIVSFRGEQIDEKTFEACDVRPWQIKGESSYLRKKIMKQMEEEGFEPPMIGMGIGPGKLNDIKMKFKENNFDERNIFQMRNNNCERE
ncbi:hypothetical protein A2442_03870 [Candidatus Campbellbacteria bacterium RIFOXYC2_FULL_35_25]|uniref:Uncharacterized protein n=1 Tax=Candidatus Campbellbacteria bacterium RIFOXYC2_FULL_35_25 TaxID=1797582 RepID=A0A1F5EJU7_9BACT|nr:MAG: hypothetical protein A2442_03870 [Candidatus Campbellbacteria bacterium RIFOXYC2_FULL_35_25]